MLESLTASVIGLSLTVGNMVLCTLVSLALGLGVAACYMVRNTYNKGFVITLALLPAIVQIVIMMVNGNIGTGVAVAGAFSLVRFRSVPGSARDILSIFLAMAIGLATGMGYLAYAALFLLIIGAASVLLFVSPFGDTRREKRTLRITIPESLDYEHVFDDLFEAYTTRCQLERVRTTNMGSLFELSYQLELKRGVHQKAFLDDLRCRNGNLNITLSRPQANKEEL